MNRWAGRVAVVTGASSGIGAAIVRDLVGHGLTVVGMARREDRIKTMSNELKGSKGKLFAVRVDLSKEADIVSAFGWVEANVGAISILVNNAGVSGDQRVGLTQGQPEGWRQILEVNVLALSICSQLAIKSMRNHDIDDGHIVNINSIFGHAILLPQVPIYSASKHGVRVLTECLRKELVEAKSKIKVSSVSPGLVATEMTQGSMLPEGVPILHAEDISNAVLYVLATPVHVQVSEMIVRPVGEQF